MGLRNGKIRTFFKASQPFLDKDSFLLNYFSDKYWAMAIPLVLFVFLVCLILMFIGLAMMYSKKKKDASELSKEDNKEKAKIN